jgi:hypothetical protein
MRNPEAVFHRRCFVGGTATSRASTPAFAMSEIFYTLREAQIVIESWRRHYNHAPQHPSVDVIEEKRLC